MSDAFDAIVLVGGGGTRLGGVDKAAVELAGRPLVQSAFDAVSNASRIVVVGDTDAPLPSRAIRAVESPRRSGPAAALIAGLRAIPRHAEWTVLLGCDLPGAAIALPRILANRARDGVTLTDPAGRPQWVVGVYRSTALSTAASRLGDPADRSLRALLGGLDVLRLHPIGTEWHDVDNWDDHRTWQARLGQDVGDGGHPS